MQIVIDISEEDYNFVKKQVADGITNPLKIRIANGTPIPKGHGRLIDVDNIQKITLEDSLTELTHKKGDEIYCYIDAPTVLEADKEI